MNILHSCYIIEVTKKKWDLFSLVIHVWNCMDLCNRCVTPSVVANVGCNVGNKLDKLLVHVGDIPKKTSVKLVAEP